MFAKRIETINRDDIDTLVNSEIPESRCCPAKPEQVKMNASG